MKPASRLEACAVPCRAKRAVAEAPVVVLGIEGAEARRYAAVVADHRPLPQEVARLDGMACLRLEVEGPAILRVPVGARDEALRYRELNAESCRRCLRLLDLVDVVREDVERPHEARRRRTQAALRALEQLEVREHEVEAAAAPVARIRLLRRAVRRRAEYREPGRHERLGARSVERHAEVRGDHRTDAA